MLHAIAYADTIYLKNGQKIDGKITNKTDKYIKIDFEGVLLTYWLDDIERIEANTNLISAVEEKEGIGQPKQFNKAESSFRIGTDYLINGKWEEAIDEFKNALSLDTNYLGAHFNLGCAYALVGEFEHALEELERASLLETAPYDAFCYFNKAGIYAKKALSGLNAKKYEEASVDFKNAIENFYKASETMPYFNFAVDFKQGCKLFSAFCDKKPEILPPLIFGVIKDYPPDSCLFLHEEQGTQYNFVFNANTVPMLFFWQTSNVNGIIGFSYFKQDNFKEADIFFGKAVEKLSSEIANYGKGIIISRTIIAPRAAYLTEDRNEAISALISFRKGKYEEAERFAKNALFINPDEYIAKNILAALKVNGASN